MSVTPADRTPKAVTVTQTPAEASRAALDADLKALNLTKTVRVIQHGNEFNLWVPRGSKAVDTLVAHFKKAGFTRGTTESYGVPTACWTDANGCKYIFQVDEQGGAAVMPTMQRGGGEQMGGAAVMPSFSRRGGNDWGGAC